MQVAFNLGPQRVYQSRHDKTMAKPQYKFYFSRKRAAQKHTNVPVEAPPVALRSCANLRVAQVIFDKNIPEEMDPVWRTQVMENVVALCEIKWQELYGA